MALILAWVGSLAVAWVAGWWTRGRVESRRYLQGGLILPKIKRGK